MSIETLVPTRQLASNQMPGLRNEDWKEWRIMKTTDPKWIIKVNKKSVSMIQAARVRIRIPFNDTNRLGEFNQESAISLAVLVNRLPELIEFEKFNPRAVKLLRKQKPFVVVAEDEVYFPDVYAMIRADEISKARWTMDDQWEYEQMLAKIEARSKRGES